MDNNFGNPNKFAIQYTFLSNPHNEKGIVGESWGVFKLLIEGKDICQYTIDNKNTDYNWNLIYILEWLCENMQYLIGYDPFPLPVQGESTLELIENADDFDSDEEDEIYLWYQAKSSWLFKHSWFCNRGGSFLSNVYFRREQENVEISWNNDFYREKEIIFANPRGIRIIPKTEFKLVIFNFLNDILLKLEEKVPADLIDDKNKITELYKKIKLLEP
ncbi:hypothetical protein [Clostridium aminobutyricum]|uniref:Uncharacterized protein n=1 Tax=Clostridium aminobutyricum TaxID=33953 RepID=A0A939IJM4_CLOAM|nr:hypothetical protein [Clostridium aminobutyricum]MBN7773729.1 hypothetical protein [Clostridium aminobutyricum]